MTMDEKINGRIALLEGLIAENDAIIDGIVPHDRFDEVEDAEEANGRFEVELLALRKLLD